MFLSLSVFLSLSLCFSLSVFISISICVSLSLSLVLCLFLCFLLIRFSLPRGKDHSYILSLSGFSSLFLSHTNTHYLDSICVNLLSLNLPRVNALMHAFSLSLSMSPSVCLSLSLFLYRCLSLYSLSYTYSLVSTHKFSPYIFGNSKS